MSKSKIKKWLSEFDEIRLLGEGGNADVYLVKEKSTGNEVALKCLRNRTDEKKTRFIAEIKVANDNADTIAGIIPIEKYDIENFWYTMPIAEPVMTSVFSKSIEEIIYGAIQLAETLGKLHDKDIHHRDIKPSNIYYYNNRFSFGDFGLVDFPESNDLTQSDKGLGAIFTIAPEMKRDPKHADASKADVYSLAKTIWMFLSGDEKGFDGVYNYLDNSHGLRYKSKFIDKHLVEIDELLHDSTQNEPDLRPDIHQFHDRLVTWCEVTRDYEKSQNSDWQFLKKLLFGRNAPSSCKWEETEDIINVLNIVGKTPAYNHMLFSDRGGLDFSYSKRAAEEGCIYIYSTPYSCYVAKPKSLEYEGFNDDYRWSYFLLSFDELDPILQKSEGRDREYLVEDTPGHYVSAQYAHYGVYDYDTGVKLPDGYKLVNRYYGGKFLIVSKNSPYNMINATYDGRHGMCSGEVFRNYIRSLKHTYSELRKMADVDEKTKGMSNVETDNWVLSADIFNKNPFEIKKDRAGIDKGDPKSQELIIKCKDYINSHYSEWDFSEIFQNIVPENQPQIKYYFILSTSEEEYFDYLDENIKCIFRDGHIKEIEEDSDLSKCMFAYSREDAIMIIQKLIRLLFEILDEKGLRTVDDYHEYFKLDFIRDGKPTHIFTKAEIENEMRAADDRVNNQLVIDEDGKVSVIQDKGKGYLYPVRCEGWCAGNNDVGKYSDLESLDDCYILCLQGWLSYLQTGHEQYMDYVDIFTDEHELMEEIKQYY